MWRVEPLRVITPFSPSPLHTYLSSPLFPHRHYLTKEDIKIIEEEAEEYLSGNKKQQLTGWWLQYIEDNVDKYLYQKGYDSTCVPYQYLDKPPKSMSLLQHNLTIIRKLLSELGTNKNNTFNPNTTNNNYNNNNITQTRVELVNPIKREVYKKVDELCNNIKLVLWDRINGYGCHMEYQHIREIRNYAFVEEAYLLLNTIREKISPHEAKGLQELIDDIVYINEIRKLDEIFFDSPSLPPSHSSSSSSSSGPSDIVPITGLIVNRIHRLENELKTVQEHWWGRVPS